MDIQGPLKIGILDDPGTTGRELHLSFTDEFKKLSLESQGAVFREYLSDMGKEVGARDEQDRNRSGMLIVQQIGEQLLPHIQAGEIGRNQAISLTDLVGPDSNH